MLRSLAVGMTANGLGFSVLVSSTGSFFPVLLRVVFGIGLDNVPEERGLFSLVEVDDEDGFVEVVVEV
jgi:hypothetical protein